MLKLLTMCPSLPQPTQPSSRRGADETTAYRSHLLDYGHIETLIRDLQSLQEVAPELLAAFQDKSSEVLVIGWHHRHFEAISAASGVLSEKLFG